MKEQEKIVKVLEGKKNNTPENNNEHYPLKDLLDDLRMEQQEGA